MGRLRPARQRQADLEMISVRDPNSIISKGRMLLGLILGIAVLATGYLYMSSERAVLVTRRFAPDAVHNVALDLKGKIFYASTAEAGEYFFYQSLFLSEIFVGILFTILNLMWERYRRAQTIDPNAKAQK
jgi:hypothetical protein